MSLCVCGCLYVYVCACLCLWLCLSVCVCVCVFMCKRCVCACVCGWLFVCILDSLWLGIKRLTDQGLLYLRALWYIFALLSNPELWQGIKPLTPTPCPLLASIESSYLWEGFELYLCSPSNHRTCGWEVCGYFIQVFWHHMLNFSSLSQFIRSSLVHKCLAFIWLKW